MERQERKYKLVSRLYYISLGLLILYAINLCVIIAFDLFQKKPFDNFTFTPSHVTGYSLPVYLQVRTFDTIINFKHEKAGAYTSAKQGSIRIKDGKSAGYTRRGIDSVLNDPAYSKSIIVQTKNIRSGDYPDGTIGEVKLAQGQANASILIQPKNLWLTVLLITRNYAAGLCILFVLFQLTRLFRKLKHNFSFNRGLSVAVYSIGFCLLLYQLLLLATGALVSLFINSVTYSETIEGLYGSKESISLHISYGINFVVIFTGLSLLVLGKLLEYGSDLQEENDLTV